MRNYIYILKDPIYDSIKQASRDIKSHDQNIISCCRRKINSKNGKFIVVKGFTYRYFDETKGCELDFSKNHF